MNASQLSPAASRPHSAPTDSWDLLPIEISWSANKGQTWGESVDEHLMVWARDLNLRKQALEQFVARSSQEVDAADLAFLQFLVGHQETSQRLRMPGEHGGALQGRAAELPF